MEIKIDLVEWADFVFSREEARDVLLSAYDLLADDEKGYDEILARFPSEAEAREYAIGLYNRAWGF